jgi:hypothetical protein
MKTKTQKIGNSAGINSVCLVFFKKAFEAGNSFRILDDDFDP